MIATRLGNSAISSCRRRISLSASCSFSRFSMSGSILHCVCHDSSMAREAIQEDPRLHRRPTTEDTWGCSTGTGEAKQGGQYGFGPTRCTLFRSHLCHLPSLHFLRGRSVRKLHSFAACLVLPALISGLPSLAGAQA